MMRALARPFWNRRHGIIRGLKKGGVRTMRLLRRLPIPHDARLAIQDLFFISVEQLILNTHLYHNWQRTRSGTERLHRLMAPEPAETRAPTAPLPIAPSDAMLSAIPESAKRSGGLMNAAKIDVIVPVYKSYDQTLNAIYTALITPNKTPFELIVINDASPDPKLSAKLREMAEARCFTLIENPENLGFVQTVNKGMQVHHDRDIVLLNADTEAYNDWLDRLVAQGESAPEVATVTPFSNNAEICSYPKTVHDNVEELEVDYATLDALAAECNAGESCELPTGVGFCMYIKRKCLKEIGYFDAETFGKGYGEENDFCLRATAAGWKHRLAGDIFVRHIGGTSFSTEKQKLVANGLKKLNARWPHYREAVHHFLMTDPAYWMRQRLDIARLRHQGAPTNILMINHSRGGGTEKHVRDLSAALREEGVGTYLLQPAPDGYRVALSHAAVPFAPNITFSLEYDRRPFFAAMQALGIAHLHVHHLIGFPQRMMDFLGELCRELGIGYDMTLHDYYMIDPRINLCDEHDFYNGEPEIEDYERLIERTGAHAFGMPVWQWRLQNGRFLAQARAVLVPDADVSTRMQRYVPEANYLVRPHPENFDGETLSTPPRAEGETLRVTILGGIAPIKGSNVLYALAKDAEARRLPIHFTIIGHTNHHDLAVNQKNVTVTGEYRDSEIAELLREHRPHLILMPSVWPETYSYTLSIALRYGIHPAVFDFGAPGRRLGALDYGTRLPLALAKEPAAMNDALLAIDTGTGAERPDNVDYANYIQDYYGLLLARSGPAMKTETALPIKEDAFAF